MTLSNSTLPKADCPMCGQVTASTEIGAFADLVNDRPVTALAKALSDADGLYVPARTLMDELWAHDPDGGPSPAQMYHHLNFTIGRFPDLAQPHGIFLEYRYGTHGGYRLKLSPLKRAPTSLSCPCCDQRVEPLNINAMMIRYSLSGKLEALLRRLFRSAKDGVGADCSKETLVAAVLAVNTRETRHRAQDLLKFNIFELRRKLRSSGVVIELIGYNGGYRAIHLPTANRRGRK
ncbi:MAG: hypothetical protein ACOH2L_15010 [Devosia sp.]